MESQTCVAKK